MKEGIYTLFAKDKPEILENGQGGRHVYSSHPMYLVKEESGNFHIVFFKNSDPMDVIISKNRITFKTVILLLFLLYLY